MNGPINGQLSEFWRQAGEYGVREDVSLETGLGELIAQIPEVFGGLLTAVMDTGIKNRLDYIIGSHFGKNFTQCCITIHSNIFINLTQIGTQSFPFIHSCHQWTISLCTMQCFIN